MYDKNIFDSKELSENMMKGGLFLGNKIKDAGEFLGGKVNNLGE